jgi:hypothetical protein
MIGGGNWPFFREAPGGAVSIRGLHFVRPKGGAIWIYAVRAVDYRLPDRRPVLTTELAGTLERRR